MVTLEGEAQTEATAPDRRAVDETDRDPAAPGNVEPTATTAHAVRT